MLEYSDKGKYTSAVGCILDPCWCWNDEKVCSYSVRGDETLLLLL